MKKIFTFILVLNYIQLFHSQQTGTFTDKKDGKTYKTVIIGKQTWVTENLNISTFRNGDPIPEAKTAEEWKKAGEEGKPAWCYYDNIPKNGEKSGKLYNWFAIADNRNICPEGWRIPTIGDFEILIKQYDINFTFENKYATSKIAGTFLKNTNGWNYNNGTNESGFAAIPGGRRNQYSFDNQHCHLWTSTEHFYTNVQTGKTESLQAYAITFEREVTKKEYDNKLNGFSVRIISDTPSEMNNPSTSVITTNNASSNQESDTKTIVYTNGVFWGLAVNDKKEGFGIMELNDGSLYEGNYSNDLKNGFGTFYFSNGDRYEGNWVNDKRNGQGTYFFNNGDLFVGTFADGKSTENGTYSYKVDKKGCVSGDCINGFGKKVFTNGVYEGNFVNGKENGKGKMTHPNKSIYDGDWKDGKKQGKGKYTWWSGSSYDGDWKDGKKQGKGLYIWGKGNSEGDKYDGDWYEDERTGWGVYTAKNGTIQEGNFEKNVYKGKELLRAVNSNNSQTNNVQHNSVDQSSAQVCNIKFSKPSGLVVKYNDNRKVCCYCEIGYAKHSLDPNQKLWDEAKYLSENLYLHFSEVKATDQHKEEDIKKLSEFINLTYKDPFMALIPAYTSLAPFSYVLSALTGEKREIGSKLRYIDQYKIASKFCRNECETNCKYFGCTTCK